MECGLTEDMSNIINEEEIVKEDISTIIKDNENIEKKVINASIDDLNFIDILTEIDIGKNYEIKGDNFFLRIRPTNGSLFSKSTYINFDECEKTLRSYYNISNTNILTFLQLELENADINSLINQIEYEIYNDKRQKLNLSICKDTNIQIYYAIKDNSYLDISSISHFKELGSPYSDSNNDVILEDRIKYYFQNFSLCDAGCEYNTINIENKTIVCNCKVKNNISTKITPLNLE